MVEKFVSWFKFDYHIVDTNLETIYPHDVNCLLLADNTGQVIVSDKIVIISHVRFDNLLKKYMENCTSTSS